ncbi:MAG: hypothetical protein LCH61_18745 [Proteobacteria bacterium]|nr:hypothetical protein [Pseudomonadota bacterium]
MKAFLSSLIVAAVISTGAYFVLNDDMQRTAEQAYTSPNARVGDGH